MIKEKDSASVIATEIEVKLNVNARPLLLPRVKKPCIGYPVTKNL
jgi:hypothetical protein